MQNQKRKDLLSQLIQNFFQGLMIIGPFGLTVFVFWYIISSIEESVPYLSNKLYPGITFLLVLISIVLIGYLGNKFVFGRLVLGRMDTVLERMPGFKHIYSPTKDLMSSFVGDKKKFTQPVWVRVNSAPEIWRIGFLTQKDLLAVGMNGKVAVYLPHSYAISGWVIITEQQNVKPVEGMSAATAMKFAVSGGVAGFHSNDAVFKSPE
ncbi:DUF502 domain-containing protein [Chryseobacterium sp. A301]